MKSTMMPSPLLLTRILERSAKIFPNVEIVSVRPDGSRHRSSYGEVHRRAKQLSAALLQAGIANGDRVATLMWNQQEHLEAYFAVPAVGAVLHTLNLRLHPEEIAYIINHAEDRFLIVDATLLDIFEQFRAHVQLERVFVVDHGCGRQTDGGESYESLLAGASGEPDYPDLDEQEAAAMCYTSGTTGKPKGVVYSHRSLSLHSLALALPDQLAVSCHDNVLPAMSMFHANGWGFPYAATMAGSRQILPGRNLQPEALLDLMETEQVTLTGGVPTIWLAVLNALDCHPGRWKLASGLRIIVAGSAAPESMFRRFDKLGVRVIQPWGMTETSPLATVCTPKPHMDSWTEDDKYALRAKQGFPSPFIEIRAVNDKEHTPWDGLTTGELEVRGPWVASGYYKLDQSDRWTNDGWFRTGDVVTIDSEGYVKITDRVKDLIKSGGEWISSVDLENALVAHDAIKEAAVIAVPHPKWAERPIAVIVLKDGRQVKDSELCAFLSQRFAKWQLPDAFVFVDELPHTSTGKLLKSKLRQQFQGWRWDQPVPANQAI
ncbi:MAG TPA: long-chain fatty acid--CoA ligase [Candidatus Sulfotelmatobacter sp.]|nr:long-chain fatty acid--CoA ligase [Candidatus Sulfotelmatobacter sp.]